MSDTLKPDFKGQRVKVAWPGINTVYKDDPAYIEFNETGQLVHSRRATHTEVQWWLTLQQSECLQRSVDNLTERVIQLLQRSF